MKKSDYEGDEAFSYNVEETIEKLIESRDFHIIVYFRGRWCPYCEYNVKEWNEIYPRILASNGELIGICSQNMERCEKTREEWNIQFPIVGDPENTFARSAGVFISKNRDAGMNGYYPWGMAQPAVIAYDKNQQQFYSWFSEPSGKNLDSAIDRPVPKSTLNEIMGRKFTLQRSDSVLMSLDTSMESFDDFEHSFAESELSSLETAKEEFLCKDCQEDIDIDERVAVLSIVNMTEQNRPFAALLIYKLAENVKHRRYFHVARKNHATFESDLEHSDCRHSFEQATIMQMVNGFLSENSLFYKQLIDELAQNRNNRRLMHLARNDYKK